MNRLLRDIGYFFLLVLMIFGVTGVIYHAVGDDGWIQEFAGGLFNHGFTVVVLIVLGVLLIGWLVRRWLVASQTNALFNDFLMYALVALGVLFLGRLVLYGSL